MKIDYQTTIGTDAWRSEFTLAEENFMKFYLGDRLVMNVKPVQINQQSEAQCLPKKTRTHHKMDGLSLRYNVSNLIPFGSEPKIERDIEFTDGFARVIEDIDPGKHAAVEKLHLDSINLPGPWARIAIVRIPAAGKSFPKPDWIEINESKDEVLFDETYPFLTVIVESHDGKRFEVGCGDDLWRWGIASELPGCSAGFTVKAGKDNIEINRSPIIFDTESKDAPEIERRTWRFKWYLSWSEAQTTEDYTDREQIVIDINDFIEKGSKSPCMHAMFSRKRIRHALRGIIANNENIDIVLKNAEAHICNRESHLDRGTRKSFLHWDAWDLMELFIWANRKGLATGCIFRISPPESGVIETPLMQRLTRKGFQLLG